MKEIFGKGILKLSRIDAIVLPSHGYVTLTGEHFYTNTSGKKASKQWKSLPKYLGRLLSFHGNHVLMVTRFKKGEILLGHTKVQAHILHLPIQPAGGIHSGSNVLPESRKQLKEGEPVAGYKLKPDLELIDRSIQELLSLSKARKWKKVAIAKPEVSEEIWKKIRRKMRRKLDNRFILVSEGKK